MVAPAALGSQGMLMQDVEDQEDAGSVDSLLNTPLSDVEYLSEIEEDANYLE